MAQAVALGGAGYSQIHIGRVLGCCRCAKLKTVKRCRETRYLKDKPGRGRTRVTIARDDRTMLREPRFRPRTTARKVQTSMRRDNDIVISLFTSRLRVDFYLFFRILYFT